MLPALTIANVLYGILIFILLFILSTLFKYFIRPYIQLQYYKKQGLITIFHRNLNPYFSNCKNAVEHDDFFYTYHEEIQAHPGSKIVAENFGKKVHLSIVDPEMTKEMLRKYEIYQKDKEVLELLSDLYDGSTIWMEEARWRKGRKIISSAFNFELLKETVPVVVDTTQESFDEWEKSKDYSNVHLIHKLGQITGESTGRTFFGKTFAEQRVLGKSMTTLVQELAIKGITEKMSLYGLVLGTNFIRMGLLARHREYNEGVKAFRQRCSEIIQEAQEKPTQEKNLLRNFLNIRKSGSEEDWLDDSQLIGEFVGIFLAGTDTTSHLVNSALYYLWKTPKALEKLREEVDRELKDPCEITLDQLNKLEYTTAVIKESLRLAGPSAGVFTRIATKDDDLCGVHVKKGTLLNAFHIMVYVMDKYYSRPREFIPERWLPGTQFSEDGFKTEPYAYIPFSAGPRNCVGQHFAMIMARIMIGLFVKRFNFSFPEGTKLHLIRKFVYEPLHPLLITVEPRK